MLDLDFVSMPPYSRAFAESTDRQTNDVHGEGDLSTYGHREHFSARWNCIGTRVTDSKLRRIPVGFPKTTVPSLCLGGPNIVVAGVAFQEFKKSFGGSYRKDRAMMT